MRRSRILVLAVAILAVMLFTLPASATHNSFVTISASSAYASVCGARPGDVSTVVGSATPKFAANRSSTLGADEKIPADLGPFAGNAGACNTFGYDGIWTPQFADARGVANCNGTSQTACRGIHLPGFGAPVRPGRFLNSVDGTGAPTPQSTCQYVTTVPGVPTQGPCMLVSVGYVLQGDSTLGGYCGSSRGFSWAISGIDAAFSHPVGTAYSIAEWQPNSAGTILPIQGSSAGPLWAKTTNGHYTGWSGTAGTPNMEFGGMRNIFGLATARSYVSAIDSQVPGGCSNPANDGALQFFSQLVTVAIGN